MKPADLCNQPGKWFGGQEGAFADIVLSSRIRLARNVKGYAFVGSLSADKQRELLERLKTIVPGADMGAKTFFIDIDLASALEKELLVERHLISKRLAQGKGPRGVIVSEDETFTAMINEEDHLRMQVYASGLQLQICWQRINQIDDQVEKLAEYAFDSRLGYLTACPTNLGTGIRVSVMLHLPALKMTGQIEKLVGAARDTDMAIRGFWGEGTEALGDCFQLSNQVTLGISENEIVEQFSAVFIPQIVAYENEARRTLLEKKPRILDDKIHRALGILSNACLIGSQEALYLLSHIRLGINLGLVKHISLKTVNDLFLLTQPAHLQLRAGRMLEADQRDSLRAEMIRQRIHEN
ncbi:MAG: protein arginine kinase [Planctomycetaceae bacterium]|nr:protein arginine kinase [Planctomycetaceae bacterium]